MSELLELYIETLTREFTAVDWNPADGSNSLLPGYLIFSRRIGVDVVGQFLVHAIAENAGVSVYPTVAVRHEPMGRLLTEFLGAPRPSQPSIEPSSLAVELHRLTGDSQRQVRWNISDATDIGSAAPALCDDFVRFGVPFLSSLTTLSDIVAKIEGIPNKDQQTNARMALGAALLGKTALAGEALGAYVDEALGRQMGLALKQSVRFVHSFVDYFQCGSEQLERLS